MKLPSLTHWEDTRSNLHRAAEVVGAFKKALAAQQINALHLSLFVMQEGLTTGRLPKGDAIALNFVSRAVEYHPVQGEKSTIPLEGQTPARIAEALTRHVSQEQGNVNLLLRLPEDVTTPFTTDPALAADYARALYTIYTGLARFRARLLGTMTPIVVWPHGFDLSFLWFRGSDPDEHSQPHMNFGFSPGSEGFPRPYLYAYAYPTPDGLLSRPLPSPARWFDGRWKGAVVDYDNLTSDEPDQEVEALAAGIYAALL
jgi:hypothetical protein